MKEPAYGPQKTGATWRCVGLVDRLIPIYRRDQVTGAPVLLPIRTTAEGGFVVVFNDDGGISFVTEPICPHENPVRRRLADTVALGPEPGTISCVHRRHLWSITDGAYCGSGLCSAMVNLPFKVEAGLLSVLVPVPETATELKACAS